MDQTNKKRYDQEVHEDLRKLFKQIIHELGTVKDLRVMQTPQFLEAIEKMIEPFEDFAEERIKDVYEIMERLGKIWYPVDIYGGSSALGPNIYFFLNAQKFSSKVFKKTCNVFGDKKCVLFNVCRVIGEEMRWEYMGY
ncbi:hypothetical protein [Helicobacter cynogastricus]|uniref:hypothetical protein n=1 Tax=Helicobacter cynogastricus TaxID=329937 RepID=UPI000CF1B8AD|nr:hypothetical protein [Helicobacter cynogastricus]